MPKLLIAEDDPLMSRFYERTFKLHKYDVELASNGEEAIAKLETMEEKPILILLDLMMPKFSGFDVLRHIKASSDLAHIPVVVLTNLASEEYAQKAIELGAVTYLVKSQYSAKEVADKIGELVSAYTVEKVPEVPETKVLVKELQKKPS